MSLLDPLSEFTAVRYIIFNSGNNIHALTSALTWKCIAWLCSFLDWKATDLLMQGLLAVSYRLHMFIPSLPLRVFCATRWCCSSMHLPYSWTPGDAGTLQNLNNRNAAPSIPSQQPVMSWLLLRPWLLVSQPGKMTGFGALRALDSSNWIAAVWGSEEPLPCRNMCESSHIALSFHKYSFQSEKPCLLSAWLPPATVLL